MKTKEQLQGMIANADDAIKAQTLLREQLQSELDAMKPTSTVRWRGDSTTPYEYIRHDGDIEESADYDDVDDNYRYAAGNYYKPGEAKKALDRQLAIVRVNDRIAELNAGGEPHEETVFEIFWQYNNDCFFANERFCLDKSSAILTPVHSSAIATQIIDEHETDLKLIMGID